MNESPGPYERMRRQVVRGVAWLLLAGLVLGGVIAAGRWSLDQLRTDDRFQIDFDDIDCDAPPGMSRFDFLGEVRYLSRLPRRLSVADPAAMGKLKEAFANHPWVLLVDEVATRPPAKVRVRLAFRTPALAVPWEGGLRVVDDRGVLLPKTAAAAGLPTYAGKPAPPGDAGLPWPDPDVVRRAMQR